MYSIAAWYKVLELLDRYQGYNEWSHRHKYPTMFLMGYHLVHRCDCSSHFKVDQPHGSRQFPFVIMTKTKWSKNVRSMQQCPDQVILASSRWKNCLILRLAVYLDGWPQQHPHSKFMFTDNNDDKLGPRNINLQFRNRLQTVAWNHPEFVALANEEALDKRGIGTHSNCKWAATCVSRLGCSDVMIQYHGRWVEDQTKHVINKFYISADHQYEDAYVASCLCDQGAIKYELRVDATMAGKR